MCLTFNFQFLYDCYSSGHACSAAKSFAEEQHPIWTDLKGCELSSSPAAALSGWDPHLVTVAANEGWLHRSPSSAKTKRSKQQNSQKGKMIHACKMLFRYHIPSTQPPTSRRLLEKGGHRLAMAVTVPATGSPRAGGATHTPRCEGRCVAMRRGGGWRGTGPPGSLPELLSRSNRYRGARRGGRAVEEALPLQMVGSQSSPRTERGGRKAGSRGWPGRAGRPPRPPSAARVPPCPWGGDRGSAAPEADGRLDFALKAVKARAHPLPHPGPARPVPPPRPAPARLTCVPTTTICGSWMMSAPTVLKTSCSLLITGINASIAAAEGAGAGGERAGEGVGDEWARRTTAPLNRPLRLPPLAPAPAHGAVPSRLCAPAGRSAAARHHGSCSAEGGPTLAPGRQSSFYSASAQGPKACEDQETSCMTGHSQALPSLLAQ